LGEPTDVNLACNIDQRGRRARLVSGVIVDTCGVALIVTGVLTDSTAILVLGIFLCVAGSFMIFEGARGWCALRALGIKTPR
jgi:uncharacterized membrane protein HdeD (DUF308 family)